MLNEHKVHFNVCVNSTSETNAIEANVEVKVEVYIIVVLDVDVNVDV